VLDSAFVPSWPRRDLLPWFLWKAHRFVLQKSPFWRVFTLPDGRRFFIRYLAEGKINYVFRVRGDRRLLKVARDYFYRPEADFDAAPVRESCALMNELAAWSLSGSGEHLGGGAFLMEDCGRALSECPFLDAAAVDRAFQDLERYSLARGTVPLDLHEDNWCWDGERLRLVDVDSTRSCPLGELARHESVRRRVGDVDLADPVTVLRAFLGEEKRLLSSHVAPPAPPANP
jgi:hypothetical protein